MKAMRTGEPLLEDRRTRRHCGDARITPERCDIFRRIARGDLASEFQAALDGELEPDPLLGGHDADDT